MKDRVPGIANRKKVTPEGAAALTDLASIISFLQAFYAKVEYADSPTEAGTPLSKANLLTDATAALMELDSSATVNTMLAALANMLTPQASTTQYGRTKLYDGNDSDSTVLAATAKAIKTLNTLKAPLANPLLTGTPKVNGHTALHTHNLDAILNFAPKLMQSYTVAGTYTWTAPDVFGDGSSYSIGYHLIGGGGSGAAVGLYQGISVEASGGASGYTFSGQIAVTPGQTYNIVVGAKGAAVTITGTDSGYQWSANGNAGGTTSAFGNTAAGGGGGKYDNGSSSYTLGAIGAQCSSPVGIGSQESGGIAPCMGSPAWMAYSGNYFNMKCRYSDCFNPFDKKRRLSAGGSAWANATIPSAYWETCVAMEDGLSGGAGYARMDSSNNVPTTHATAASSPGSGGGGLVISTTAAHPVSFNNSYSGAGADGACLIYLLR